MSGSSFGTAFKITTWGESHGRAVGAVIDGCPAGIPLCEDDINQWLTRRKPGQSVYSTKRAEDDNAEILSGVFDGRTTGTPISVIVHNNDARSSDYKNNIYRPSHADFTYDAKYGFRDFRGGGRASGRETIGRVIAGAVAAKALNIRGIDITAYVLSIGGVNIDIRKFDSAQINDNPLRMPDRDAFVKAASLLDKLIEDGDSIGGVVECVVSGLPAGIGEPVFSKLDAEIAKAVMSIGAVKGVEFGTGFKSAELTGSENNDGYYMSGGSISKITNNSGGVAGGISEGSPLIFRAAFKPTPSISIPQNTVTAQGSDMVLSIKGRHDPIIAPRAVVVVEAMAAVVILDLMIMHRGREGWLK